MSKEVTVEELREKLEELLAEMKGGETVSIVENGKTIGTIEPTFVQRGVRYPFRGIDFGTRPKKLTIDIVDLIREDRDSRG